MVIESYFDGQLFKNKIWVGTVEGQHLNVSILVECLMWFTNFILPMQAFLFISLNPIILISSFGEDNFMAKMMISDDFHILAVQLLSLFFKLARIRISFIAMIGRQHLLYDLSNSFYQAFVL